MAPRKLADIGTWLVKVEMASCKLLVCFVNFVNARNSKKCGVHVRILSLLKFTNVYNDELHDKMYSGVVH